MFMVLLFSVSSIGGEQINSDVTHDSIMLDSSLVLSTAEKMGKYYETILDIDKIRKLNKRCIVIVPALNNLKNATYQFSFAYKNKNNYVCVFVNPQKLHQDTNGDIVGNLDDQVSIYLSKPNMTITSIIWGQ